MIVVDLQWALYMLLLVVAAIVLLAVALDRRRFRDPLLLRSGASAGELGSLLETAPFGLMLLDAEQRCRYANVAAGMLLSWPTRWGTLPKTAWQAALSQDMVTAHARGQAHTRTLHLPDGRRLRWWLCPLPDLTLLVLSDQSQRARLERASRAFLGTLSHELRTPLTAILAHMAVIQADGRGDDHARDRSIAVVQQEAERLARLVQDLLQLGRLEMSDSVARRPLDLALVAEAAIAEVILAAEEREIALSLETESSLPRVLGAADGLQRAFLNLLDNSIRYCRPGDRVVVQLAAAATGVTATIADSGPGIATADLPHVTERLYRGRTDVPGSGLGLAVVAEILRQHESSLKINNREESGVVVQFTLPIAGRPRPESHGYSETA